MKKNNWTPVLYAILAAALYAINSPFSKLLLNKISPTMMAAFLYLGAGIGMGILRYIKKRTGKASKEIPLTKKELPYTIGMIILDIIAPIFLMIGLSLTSAANASLLNNFEIVATSLIAMIIFKENISKRLWIAIGLVTASSIILSFENFGSLSFSLGSIFVLLACVSWGFENNCTRMMSDKDPTEIAIIKGLCSGMGSFIIALILRESLPSISYIFSALLLGFVAYGLSIFFYVHAQRSLGAAKTSTYYAIAPFIGVAFSLIIFRNNLSITFIVALVIMIIGTYYASTDI